MPHAFHEIDGFGAPVFAQTGRRGAFVFMAHGVVDIVFVMALPGVFLVKNQLTTQDMSPERQSRVFEHE